MRTHKVTMALVTGLGALSLLGGCLGPNASINPVAVPVQILSVNLQNPQPRVGESTTLRLEVLAGWFRNPIFYYRAKRGRVVGINGETGPQGGYVRAGNQVRYFAPYTSNYPAPDGIRQDDVIEILAQDGNHITRLNHNVNIIGSTVVFSTQQVNGQNGTLMIATDSGGGVQSTPQPLMDLANREIQGTSPSIAPNGERIAYVFYPGDGTSKIMMRDASGQVLALTNNARGLALDPAWSPDGSYLVFASNHETTDGTYDIYMMSVDQSQGGRAVNRLTNNNWDDRHPAWNPLLTASEDRILAVSARKNTLQSPGGRAQNWNVFLMDRKGNYTREISQVQGDGDNWAIEPAWRPDGNALAYTRFGPVTNYQAGASKFQRIFVQDLSTSTTLVPVNISNTDPNARESSPIWALDRTNDLVFLRTEGNFAGGARVFRTTYQPGGGNTFPPQLVGPFQQLSLPLTMVGGTNREISGYHPLDWR